MDGIIASDGGVIEMLKEYAPDVEVHISTQSNVVSNEACNIKSSGTGPHSTCVRKLKKKKKVQQEKYIVENQ